MQGTEEVRREILKRKIIFYYTLNLKCHIKFRPTGSRNGNIISNFVEDGSFFMFQDLRKTNPERLFLDEIFDIKDYEEVIA